MRVISLVLIPFFAVFSTIRSGYCADAHKSLPSKKLPNIVLIFLDDVGYADFGVFGARGYSTPNIDKLAHNGMKFTDFHAAQGVCSASRAGLLTGCYPNRVGVTGALMPWSKTGLNPAEETIAELLKSVGYSTGCVGKWHLGHEKKFLPLQQGFDEYLGLPYSNDMWPVDYDGNPIKNGRMKRYPQLPLIEGNEKIAEIRTLKDQATLTTRYTEWALSFIERHKSKPFFLYMPHSMAHIPLAVSDKFKGKTKRGLYGDVMMEIDWSVGQVVSKLKQCGLLDNTLIILTSDNGPWLCFGNHAGSAWPLREGKGTMWEGGCREPCIMSWPGHIPKDSVCRKLASTIDILPTLCAITGARLPKRKIDGVNILNLMLGRKDAEPRGQFVYYYGNELQAMRVGPWKLNFPHKYRSVVGMRPGENGHSGHYTKARTGWELYNLQSDISEVRNVADLYPEKVRQLRELGKKELVELNANKRNPGKVE